MTSFLQPLARASAVAVLFLTAFAGAAHAGGTAAGTSITNSATLDYKIGNVTQSQICSSVSGNSDLQNCLAKATAFTVDNKIDVLVAVKDTGAVTAVPGGVAYVQFDVSNKGNLAQTLALEWFHATSATFGSTTHTDTLNPTSCVIRDSNDAAISNDRISFAIDELKVIRVSCTFPTINGTAPFTLSDYAVIGLKATAVNPDGTNLVQSTANTAGMDILFADGQGKYAGDDGPRDAAHTDRSAFNMKPALLSVSKAVDTICDPITGEKSASNLPRNIPGAMVRYTIKVANAANASTATLQTITDALKTSLAFDANFVTGAGDGSKCSSATGARESGGKGVKATVQGGRATTYPVYLDKTAVVTGSVATGGETITFSPTTAWPTVLPAESAGGYAEGDLRAGETLTLEFNVTIQ